MQLLEAEVGYLPNAACRTKEGRNADTGDYVEYQSMINENMLCAQDMDSDPIDEDTCVGDSGGPIVLPQYDNDGVVEDLQVGVVSWGIGCASQTFPGVYARVSTQYEWIRKTVCVHSSEAPESFECDGLSEDELEGGGVQFPAEEEEME